jgi:archaemetzincin
MTDGECGPWIRLPAPQPGEWRFVYSEKERSFEAFQKSRPLPPPSEGMKIYIQPLGNVARAHPELLSTLEAFVETYFARDAEVLPSLPVPSESFNAYRSQYDAGEILSFLERRVPPDACCLLGLLERDIFYGDYSFLYGLGSLRRGLGICSVARYNFQYIGQPPQATFRMRALKVAAHEIAHALGLRHCATFRCVLNGSNSIVEADRSPVHLCPLCHRKLAWLLSFDPDGRRDRLAALYGTLDEFGKEAAFLAQVPRSGAGRK